MLASSVPAGKLACDIVMDQFGEVVERVCRSLVQRGQQTLAELVRDTTLPVASVRSALLVLLQHNCARAWRDEPPEADGASGLGGLAAAAAAAAAGGAPRPRPGTRTIYFAEVGRITQRLRHPRCLQHISTTLGRAAEEVLAALLEHGRMRLSQLVERAQARGAAAAGAGAAGGGPAPSPAAIRSQVERAFLALVNAHYVERAPTCTGGPPALPPTAPAARGRGRASSAASAEAEAIQAQALAAEAHAALSRFQIPAGLLTIEDDGATDGGGGGRDLDGGGGFGGFGGEGGGAAAKRKARGEEADAAAGGRRVRPKLEPGVGGGLGPDEDGDDDEGPPFTCAAPLRRLGTALGGGLSGLLSGSSGPASEVTFRANLDEFNRRFRHQSCVALVRQKSGRKAAGVLAAMFSISRVHEASVREERSVPMTEVDVAAQLAALPEAEGGGHGASADAAETLKALAADTSELISCVGESPAGAMFCANMRRIMELVRLKELEAVVRDRFGQPACRVFRLVVIKRQLEQKQIADLAMIPAKDTRVLLYRLLRAGYLSLQEIPKTADHAPARTTYLFRAEFRRASERLAGELLVGAHRLRARLEAEMTQHRELLDLLDQSSQAAAAAAKASAALAAAGGTAGAAAPAAPARPPPPALTAGQFARLDKFRKTAAALEVSLLRLDNTIMLFNHI